MSERPRSPLGVRPLGFSLLAISSGVADGSARAERRLLAWVEGLAPFAPAVAIQMREKRLDDRAAFRLVERSRSRFPGVLLVNGRPDLAAAAGAEGVHLPGAGLPPGAVRARWGRSLLLGLSVHSVGEAAAHAASVDYFCLAPVYPTPGKPGARPLGLRALGEAARLGPAVLALGGVDSAARIRRALDAGAHGVAGIRLFADPSRLPPLLRAAGLERGHGATPAGDPTA